MRTKFVIILSTFGSLKEAQDAASRLLDKKLVACANIVTNVKSRFWWKTKIDSCNETLVLFKTTERNFRRVEKEISRMHSYDVPEIIAVPIMAGNNRYLKWLEGSCSGL